MKWRSQPLRPDPRAAERRIDLEAEADLGRCGALKDFWYVACLSTERQSCTARRALDTGAGGSLHGGGSVSKFSSNLDRARKHGSRWRRRSKEADRNGFRYSG